MAEKSGASARIIIRNVRIFDGVSGGLTAGHVLIEGARIATVSASPIAEDGGAPTTVIDGGDRVLMPGMADAHVHLVGNANNMLEMVAGSQSLQAANTVVEARNMLMRGFTAVRDMAGDTSGIKTVIDEGKLTGPRIYPSQAAISQTSGHGDFGFTYDTPVALGGAESRAEEIGFMRVADGPAMVTAAVREQLKKGASQIKLMTGGGAASMYDPLYTLQFTPEEIRAAVQAAEDYGTYVATHVYTVAGVRRAVEAGVRSVEHGQLVDEDTVKVLADKGAWLSLQPFAEHDHHYPDPDRAQKNREICNGVDNVYGWAREHGVKVAFGTDLLLEPQQAPLQSEMMTRLGRYYSNADALRMVTSGNAELFRMSGERDPYRHGRIGEITEGAFADVLLVDSNPLEDLSVLAKPEEGLRVIIKDGRVCKNTLGDG